MPALYRIETPGSIRLNENWYVCDSHVNTCRAWLHGREKAWGFSGAFTRVMELQPPKA
jgi:hypothetical protein